MRVPSRFSAQKTLRQVGKRVTKAQAIAISRGGAGAGGTDPDAVHTGDAAGGALDGTYPNPGLAAAVAGNGLAETSDVLSVNVDGVTVELSGDALRIKDAGVTAAKLAAAVAGAGLTGGGGSALAVGAGTGITVNADDVAVDTSVIATKSYADALIASNDAMVFKGVIDCSANPNYPAADRGHTYRVSVEGKIGGGSGPNVEAGDLLVCLTDGTSAGTHASVGSAWSIAQANIDGAVTGPASATNDNLAGFDGTSGKVIEDSGAKAANVPTDGQKQALGGSFGTPDSSNVFVTSDDPVFDGQVVGQDLAHDAQTVLAAGTGNLSGTHTPVGTPTGILVLIAQNVGATDEVTSVTYGGVQMQELPWSPLLHTNGSEDGALYAFFLGFDIPTGAQTVTVNVNGTGSSKRAVVFSVTSGKPVRPALVAAQDSSAQANPSVTLALPSTMECAVYGVLHSGHDDVSSLAAASGFTEVQEHDFGSQTASWIRRTANTSGGDTSVGWTATSEENGILGVALTQVPVRAFGRITALPTRASIGDTAQYAAATTPALVGVQWDTIWDLVYDGESSYPWKKIGGPPLAAATNNSNTRNANSYAAITNQITVTAPLAGDYDVTIGATIQNAAGAVAYLSYAVGGTAANDNWAAVGQGAAAIISSGSITTRQTGVSASASIAEQAKSTTGTSTFDRRRLIVDPIRVG